MHLFFLNFKNYYFPPPKLQYFKLFDLKDDQKSKIFPFLFSLE
jgi:hypothetical protein